MTLLKTTVEMIEFHAQKIKQHTDSWVMWQKQFIELSEFAQYKKNGNKNDKGNSGMDSTTNRA